MKAVYAFFFLWAPAVLIAMTWAGTPEKYQDFSKALPMMIGIFAFVWMTGEILLSARLKFVERHFGLDRMLRFHGLIGVGALLTILAHKLLMEPLYGESAKTAVGTLAFLLVLALSALSVLVFSGMLGRWFKWAANFRRKAETFRLGAAKVLHIGSFEWQKALHNGMVLAYSIAFVHVLMVYGVRSHPEQMIAYITLYGSAMSAWIWHKAVRPAMQKAEAFVVVENVQEADGVRTIRMKPERGGASFADRMAGTFGFFTPVSSGVAEEEHPFTISSAPAPDGSIAITAKALGDFTGTLHGLKSGDRIRVDGPYGRFSPDAHPEDRKLVLIAGGIGITPMMGILEHLSRTDPDRHVLLLWGLNRRADQIRSAFWDELERTMPNLRFVPVWFRDPEAGGEQGVVDRERIARLTSEHGFATAESGYYVCGPGPMLEGVLKSLNEIGVSKTRIRHERFAF